MELRVCTGCEKVVGNSTKCPDCGRQLTLAEPTFFVGHTFGKYTIEKVLGVGGMGVVYQAEHRSLLRRAALKLVLPRVDDTTFRRRFLREARVLAELRHPNIVEIYDFDVNDWGVPYYVMEYLEGKTLRQIVSRRGPLPWSELGPILDEVASGLASVHRHGIVHRDLKPENIFLAQYDDRQVAKVLDFGIAKPAASQGTQTHLTETGLVVGTINYLSPEQILEGEIGPATDQYALALVTAELLTGKAVRAGKTMARIISDEISRPVVVSAADDQAIPAAFSEVIRRATMPEPQDRYDDIKTFVAHLHRAADLPPSAKIQDSPSDEGPTRHLVGSGGQATAPRERPTLTHAVMTDVVSRKGLFRWTSAIMGTAIGLGLLWLMFGSSRTPPASSATPVGAGFTVAREIPVPLDADSIVTMTPETIVLTGLDGLILQPENAGLPATRAKLEKDSLLGTTPEGDLVVRRGDEAQLRSLFKHDTMLWAQGIPDGDLLAASPDTRWLAFDRGDALEIVRYDRGRYRPSSRLPMKEPIRFLSVGTRLIAAVTGGSLQVWSLETGETLLERSFSEGRIAAVAIHDDAELVAVAGWFDRVFVFDLRTGSTSSIPRVQGADESVAIEFLEAGPTLAIGDAGEVTLWQPNAGIVGSWRRTGADIIDLAVVGDQLLALDAGATSVLVFRLGGMRSTRILPVGHGEPWTAVTDPTASRVLIGNADGSLNAVDLDTGSARSIEIHTQGVTSLVVQGDRLGSASDDKTIAVWRLPDLTVEWRSRAHDFLINQLSIDRRTSTLWSTSSDHSLKIWTWPSLEEVETVSTSDAVGEDFSLAALWVAPGGNRVVLGTWNRMILVMDRAADGSWTGTSYPFDPQGGYSITELPAIEALVIAGVSHPFALAVYDLEQKTLTRLRGANRAVRAVVTTGDGSRVLGFGDRLILDYRFDRDENGDLHYRMAAVHHPDLGESGAATVIDADTVAVANDAGDLHILSTAAVDGPILCDVTIGGQDHPTPSAS